MVSDSAKHFNGINRENQCVIFVGIVYVGSLVGIVCGCLMALSFGDGPCRHAPAHTNGTIICILNPLVA